MQFHVEYCVYVIGMLKYASFIGPSLPRVAMSAFGWSGDMTRLNAVDRMKHQCLRKQKGFFHDLIYRISSCWLKHSLVQSVQLDFPVINFCERKQSISYTLR